MVVTGAAGLCPLGRDWITVRDGFLGGRSGVRVMDAWADVRGLQTRLGAPVPDFATPPRYPRQKIRSMGRTALLATCATESALASAGLTDHPAVTDGSAGLAYGSTSGSPPAILAFGRHVDVEKNLAGLSPNTYFQLMSHTTAANLAQFFGLKGRVLSTCSACASGSQAIGYAFETIRAGKQAVMIAGGAEELHVTAAAVFDVLFAASLRRETPAETPRPFDRDRDGLVVGEGAATLILEEAEHARARGATPWAEVLGFGTNADGTHLTDPDDAGMEDALRRALADAELPASAVDYVNAHGTATERGDIAESRATARVVGPRTPVSTFKGHLGHTLGACGAVEAWITLAMMREGWIFPTKNLERVDDRCAELDYVRGAPRRTPTTVAMSNNFAFGGINTSLIFRRM